MSATTLEEIRQKLLAAESKNNNVGTTDNTIFPHWNLQESQSCLLRFLPDGNPDNVFFWQERSMIRLPFAGIKGDTDTKNVMVQIPCMEMWKEPCPVLSEVRNWFKDKSLEEMGRKYWKKRSYFFQGFARESQLTEDNTPENPIRRFIIGPQIFTIIKSALMDPELEVNPTDYMRGLDFRITKTAKGGFADYNTSKWSRKESALTAAEQEAIEKYGLHDLSTFLPKKPGEVELRVIKEMFQASVDGLPYDTERWGQYYRPAGVQAPGQSFAGNNKPSVNDGEDDQNTASTAKPTTTESAPTSQASGQTRDILEMIKSRKKA